MKPQNTHTSHKPYTPNPKPYTLTLKPNMEVLFVSILFGFALLFAGEKSKTALFTGFKVIGFRV